MIHDDDLGVRSLGNHVQQIGHYIPAIRLGVAEPAREAAPIPAERLGVIPGPAILGVLAAVAAFSRSNTRSRSLLLKKQFKPH